VVAARCFSGKGSPRRFPGLRKGATFASLGARRWNCRRRCKAAPPAAGAAAIVAGHADRHFDVAAVAARLGVVRRRGGGCPTGGCSLP
jgi:hypothetical protein